MRMTVTAKLNPAVVVLLVSCGGGGMGAGGARSGGAGGASGAGGTTSTTAQGGDGGVTGTGGNTTSGGIIGAGSGGIGSGGIGSGLIVSSGTSGTATGEAGASGTAGWGGSGGTAGADGGKADIADAVAVNTADALVSDVGDTSSASCQLPDASMQPCLMGEIGGVCGGDGYPQVCVAGEWTCGTTSYGRPLVRLDQCKCISWGPDWYCTCTDSGWVCAIDGGAG